MKKISTIILSLLLAAVFTLPVFARAAASPGVKPGNFFYFFDTSFEKIGLFFTFSPEKKARRALQYADERLAEAEAVAENAEGVKTAIANYESNIVLAAEKSKGVGKEKAEALLTTIADNTSKHQEILAGVLAKVPDEAKEAIIKAIEASRKGQEEAMQKIAELKGEVEKLKQEVEELKKEADDPQTNEIEKLKKEVEALKEKQKTVCPVLKQPIPVTQQPQETKKPEEKFKTVTLPSGAVVETDANGNIIRYIQQPLIDLCNNIEGAQSYVPSGMIRDADGNCIVPLTSAFIHTPLIPTLNASAIKAADIKNKITAYLLNLDGLIMAKNQEINARIIAENIANSLAAKTTTVCPGIKTSGGCELNTKFSVDMGITVANSVLAQLLQKKDKLSVIYNEVDNYGNGGELPSAENISFLTSIGITW